VVGELTRDFLIVGQGLAGSALALALQENGGSVMVVDSSLISSASEVAAGLITPLAGKGMNPGWRQEKYLSEAVEYYIKIEKKTGKQFFYPFPVVRPFKNGEEKEKFNSNREKREPWVDVNVEIDSSVNAEFGYFMMRYGGRLDTKKYLKSVRELLADDFYDAEVKLEDLSFQNTFVEWKEMKFSKVIFCSGYSGLLEGLFSFLPSRSAKGEMLTVEIEDLDESNIISRNGWLVPLGDNIWRAGASYAWDELNSIPTEDGRDNVEERIKNLISCSYKVINHEAGVRPIVNNSQPVIGFHPEYKNVGIFNGLGSKGAITSRSVAVHFSKVLLDQCKIDPELDYRRLNK